MSPISSFPVSSSPSPSPSSTSLKDDGIALCFDSISTTSTDSDSSFSMFVEAESTDIETPFGAKLRHRTGELIFTPGDASMGDSDSEHGPVPRRRRQASLLPTSRALYAFVFLLGLCLSTSMKSRYAHVPQKVVWKSFLDNEVPMIRKALSTYEAEDHYTIILKGRRLDLLQQSLDRFARCPNVKDIHLDYEGAGDVPIPLQAHDSMKVVPAGKDFSTEALFLLSEGVLLSCNEMEKGEYLHITELFVVFRFFVNNSSHFLDCFLFSASSLKCSFSNLAKRSSSACWIFWFHWNTLK
jgi:hypothetical protein